MIATIIKAGLMHTAVIVQTVAIIEEPRKVNFAMVEVLIVVFI